MPGVPRRYVTSPLQLLVKKKKKPGGKKDGDVESFLIGPEERAALKELPWQPWFFPAAH